MTQDVTGEYVLRAGPLEIIDVVDGIVLSLKSRIDAGLILLDYKQARSSELAELYPLPLSSAWSAKCACVCACARAYVHVRVHTYMCVCIRACVCA